VTALSRIEAPARVLLSQLPFLLLLLLLLLLLPLPPSRPSAFLTPCISFSSSSAPPFLSFHLLHRLLAFSARLTVRSSYLTRVRAALQEKQLVYYISVMRLLVYACSRSLSRSLSLSLSLSPWSHSCNNLALGLSSGSLLASLFLSRTTLGARPK
jgi:hypothetical protein